MLDVDQMYGGHTPHGRAYTMAVRPGTSDWNTAHACSWVNDEYKIPEGITGWALDVGAHIGAWAVPFALDNPTVRVVCIEAFPENADILRENIGRNGLEDRVFVILGAAGDGAVHRVYYHGEDLQHRFIGNADPNGATAYVEYEGSVTLDTAAELAVTIDPEWPGEWRYAKIDCEGCEYPFLAHPGIKAVRTITGEVHFGWDRLVEILAPTHEVAGEKKDFGHFTAERRS